MLIRAVQRKNQASGQAMVEYGLVIATIIVFSILALSMIGTNLQSMLTAIAGQPASGP